MAERGRLSGPLPRLLAAVAAALAGGAAFAFAGLPAAWLSGAMAGSAVAALSGLRAEVPARVRDAVFLVLGISLGAGVTPAVVEDLPTWPLTMAGLAVTMVAATTASYVWLRRVGGFDPASAYFGSIPGALSMTLAVAETTNADLRLVATSQTIRLFMLVAVLPPVVAALGSGPAPPGADAGDPVSIALMLGAGVAGGVLGALSRLPAGLLLGAFAASGALHATGIVEGPVPDVVLVPAFVILGAGLGLRFSGTGWRELASMATAAVGAFAAAMATASAGAVAVAALSGVPAGQVLVAFAPGGLEAMTILAFVLMLDPTFVAAHHLARFLAMAAAVPVLARFFAPRPPPAAPQPDA